MIFRHPPTDFKPNFKVASCFLEVDGKILFLQYQPHKYQGTWCIPSGKIEPPETREQAVSRELHEETGIHLPPGAFTYFDTIYVRYPDFDFTFHMFKYHLDAKPEVTIDTKEHQRHKWVTSEEALQMDIVPDGLPHIHIAYPCDPPYWTSHLKKQAGQARSFKDLVPIAMTILESMPHPIGEVCGPLSNGGTGDMAAIENNSARFKQAINNQVAAGHSIFDQTQFTEHVIRIAGNDWKPKHNEQLLNDFYIPIFESGLVSTFYFMPNWKSSAGATWEHEQAQKLGIEILYLDDDLHLPQCQEKDYQRMSKAQTFTDLSDQALEMMRRNPRKVDWLCGPLTNGGVGTVTGNAKVFVQVLERLNQQGRHIFNQIPFKDDLNRINNTHPDRHGLGEKTDLLQGFYAPIFSSGLIDTVFFMPDWKTSAGARWEHDTLTNLGAHIVYLEPDYSIPQTQRVQSISTS